MTIWRNKSCRISTLELSGGSGSAYRRAIQADLALLLNEACSRVRAMSLKPCVTCERPPVFDARQIVIPILSRSSSMQTAVTRRESSVEADMKAKLSTSCLSRYRGSCRPSSSPLRVSFSCGLPGTSHSVHSSVIFSTKHF